MLQEKPIKKQQKYRKKVYRIMFQLSIPDTEKAKLSGFQTEKEAQDFARKLFLEKLQKGERL